MSPCVRSHTHPGEHTPPCTCTRECPDHEGHCPGCLPVEATHGLICDRDSRILRGFLGAEEGLDPDHPVHGLPWAWEHLENAYPSLSQAPGGGGSSVDDPEAERLSAVLSVRFDVHDVLAAWVEAVADHAGLAGPDLTVHLQHDRDSTGARRLAWITRVRRRTAWLLTHVEALESHEAVAEAWQELADLMSRAHALAPWRPAPTEIRGIPCRCGAFSLHDHGDEVKCWSLSCRWSFSRAEYAVWVKVLARRFGDQAQESWERKVLTPETAGYGGRA
jgi:hypothetical protein